MDDRPAVLLVALDGFPYRAVGPQLTPVLAGLAASGAMAGRGGYAPLPSSTYPGFSDLLTGVSPERHGIRLTFGQDEVVPPWAGERAVRVPTIIDACRAAGVAAEAMLADHTLYPVLRLGRAEDPWPIGGRPGAGLERDALGYVTHAAALTAMIPYLVDRGADSGLVFLHLNEADSIGHIHGPGDPVAHDAYARTDAAVGRILDAIRADWARWVVIVVSDHDMEDAADREGLVPMDLPGVAGIAEAWVGDGGCGWLLLRRGVEIAHVSSVLDPLPEVVSWASYGDRIRIDAPPGREWHAGRTAHRGTHGGPSAARTLAIVGGGHPAAVGLACALRQRSPRLRDWAPTIAGLLGVPFAGAEGRDLLAGSSA